jgi:hypothetical protein
MKPTAQQFEVMSLQKFNTGVLFHGPRHTFIRNPLARSRAYSAITRTTWIVVWKPNHGKTANSTSQQVEYRPSKDHPAKLTLGQSRANEYCPALEWAARKTQMVTSSQVKLNSYPFVQLPKAAEKHAPSCTPRTTFPWLLTTQYAQPNYKHLCNQQLPAVYKALALTPYVPWKPRLNTNGLLWPS